MTDYDNLQYVQNDTTTLKVVLYLRQSDREQRLSISQQREECRSYAASRRWQIVNEYIDDGKSGSKSIEKRLNFHRMISEAQNPLRDWAAILVWDTSRFSRLDPLTGAEYKQKLRKVGVWLETTKGEKIDWGTSMGRVLDAVKSEADHEYSLNISRNVVRGRRAILALGYMATAVPYGYDRQYYENSEARMVIPRRQVFSKPRNWHLKPIPNEREARIVKWLYHEWFTKDMSLTGTVRLLSGKSIPGPGGKPDWTLQQVKNLLTERLYIGDAEIGSGIATHDVHNRIGQTVQPNAFPPLIERHIWDAVQIKIKAREGAEWRPRSSSGLLSGICKCGHCGHTMARRKYKGRTKYVCESQIRRPSLGCHQWRIDEAEVLPIIIKELMEAVDFEIVKALESKPQISDSSAELIRLKKQEANCKRQLVRAAKNVLLVDPENFEDVQQQLTTLRKQHEFVVDKIHTIETTKSSSEQEQIKQWWEKNKDDLIELSGKIFKGDTPHNPQNGMYSSIRPIFSDETVALETKSFRELLQRLKVELKFYWKRRGQTQWSLTSGVLNAQIRPNTIPIERNVKPNNQDAGTNVTGSSARS